MLSSLRGYTKVVFSSWRLLLFIGVVALSALFVTGHGATLVSLLASSASSLNGRQAVLFFAPHEVRENGETFAVGETIPVNVQVNTSVPIDAIGATILFSPDDLDIMSISKEHSFFDLWTEDTTIKEGAGEVHFSGGTYAPEGHRGIGTILTMSVRARRAGTVKLSFADVQIFAHDGTGRAISSEGRSFATTITEINAPATPPAVAPAKPTPDFNDDGAITLADMSILVIQLLSSYNTRFDLNLDGFVGLADVSVIFAQMGTSPREP